MQASKIKIGKVYAIEQGKRLVRFHVDAVVTRRKSEHNNPHDYESTVEGIIQHPDRVEGEKFNLTLDPSLILGPYEEHVALVEREEAERAARKAADDAKNEKRERLIAHLYAASGLERPVEKDGFGRYTSKPISSGYNSIDINAEAIEPLLAFFERLKVNA